MITVEEFVERICQLGADRGPRRFPRRRRDREILMRSILMTMDSSRNYSEPEINEILITWKRSIAPAIETDHVTLRRLLVDYGEFERTPDGAFYRVGFPPRPVAFELEIEEIDIASTVAAYIDHRRRQRLLQSKKART